MGAEQLGLSRGPMHNGSPHRRPAGNAARAYDYQDIAMARQNRRQFLKQLALGGGAVIAAPNLVRAGPAGGGEMQLRQKIQHIIVCFQENRSFDHYFGTFAPKSGQHVVNLLDAKGKLDQRFTGLQKNPAGIAYRDLPLPSLPGFQNVQLPNGPFHVAPYIPANGNVHWDPKHRFFRMMAEVNNGKMDLFVALAGAARDHLSRADLKKFKPEQLDFDLAHPSGPVLGYYKGEDIPFYHRVAHHYTLFDHFYQAMSGGSTGNALYLVAARSCVNPGAGLDICAPFDPKMLGVERGFFDLPYDHKKVMINDLPPVQGPTNANDVRALKIAPPPAAQTYPNIGDRLSRQCRVQQ